MIIESEFSDNAEGEEIFKKHLTLKLRYDIISTLTIWQRIKYAGVAELADALASGASDAWVVWVQVPSPAPKQDTNFDTMRILIGVRFLYRKSLFNGIGRHNLTKAGSAMTENGHGRASLIFSG